MLPLHTIHKYSNKFTKRDEGIIQFVAFKYNIDVTSASNINSVCAFVWQTWKQRGSEIFCFDCFLLDNAAVIEKKN